MGDEEGSGMHSAFTYLTVGKSELYRRVMLAFVAAKRRFTVHLRPEDVHAALGGTPDLPAVAEALVALEGWGNLRSDPDTSRVTTVEDFHRARFLYQLTREGEAAEEALAVYDDALGRRGALQAVALTCPSSPGGSAPLSTGAPPPSVPAGHWPASPQLAPGTKSSPRRCAGRATPWRRNACSTTC
jgi:hypothetical protein